MFACEKFGSVFIPLQGVKGVYPAIRVKWEFEDAIKRSMRLHYGPPTSSPPPSCGPHYASVLLLVTEASRAACEAWLCNRAAPIPL